MSAWIFPSNPKMYDILGALQDLPYIYWTQRLKNIEAGDVVYIYVSSPVSRIVHKCVVEETNIPFSLEILNDKNYWRNGFSFDSHLLTRKYVRLRPLESNQNEKLNFWGLRAHGETSYLMGAKRIKDEQYLSYIERNFGLSSSLD
jgi:hypothetical protein